MRQTLKLFTPIFNILKIVKVWGDSMSPLYNDGDYVFISSIPLFFNKIKENSVIVFKSPLYGILIKKVCGSDADTGLFYVKGINPSSLSSETIGPVKKNDIIGTVLLHIARK